MRGIVAAGLVVAMTAFVGCSEEPEPRFAEPSETPSASASEPTSSAAAEPEPWEEKSRAGAVAFAKFWVETLNDAQISGDVGPLKASSTSRCVTCRDLAAQLEGLYGGGGRMETEGWNILLVGPPPGALSNSTVVTLRIARAPQRVFEGEGPPTRYDGDRSTFSAGLIWQHNQWLMDKLVRFT